MKQLTMTKVLTPLAALAFAFGVQAATVGLQSSDGFESYTAGTTVITNQTGWFFEYGTDGADDASAITAYDNNAPTGTLLPDAFSAAGDNYLKLSTEDGMLFRNMDGDAGEPVDINAGLYVDTDVQFTITDPSDRPEVTGDDKFIVWLEADGADTNLCVWAREFTVANGEVSVTSNKVYKLASADIVPGEWHRLTVKALAAVGDTYKFPAFQIYLDGVQLAAASEYIVDQAGESDFMTKVGASIVTDQLYFPAMANSLNSLSKVGFSGEGALDNVAVTYAVPAFSANSAQVAFTFDEGLTGIGMSSLGQTITTSGDSVSVETNTSFVITLEGYNENAYTYTFTPSGNITYNPETRTVTVLGSGAATLAIVATAKDTVNVTFNWDDLNTAMGESVSENTGISFTVGADDVHNADIENETSMTISNLKVGTNITITVTFSARWKATYSTSSANVSIEGNVVTVNARGDGTATVSISAEQLPSPVTIGGTGYETLAAAALAATAGQTITLNEDVAGAKYFETAAGTIDLNGYKLTGTSAITFTGSGATTIKGGEIAEPSIFTITNVANEKLTLDGVTFHATVTPVGSGDVFLATNCQFLCDLDTSGNALVRGATVHSYGILLGSASQFTRADVVDNWFAQGRRAAVQASFPNDLYFYGNTVDGSVDTTATDDKTGDVWALYPALQIFSNGRVFIENNTFTGQYLGEAFCIYNKGAYRSTDAAVVFNGNTVESGVNYLWGIYDVDKTGAAALVNPNLYFGANTIGAGVDTEHCIYKATVDGVDMNGVTYSHTPANLALPTGVATVYEWTHGANAAYPYNVTLSGVPSYAANLSEVEAGATIIAVPGAAEPADTAELVFTVDSTYKNKWTAAAPAAAGWVDDSSTIVADTTAGAQYSDLAGTALADADAKELTDWAKAKSIDYSAVVAAPGDFVEAFLLNCAVADVATEKAAFKANITVAADGTVTVTLDDTTKTYNGTLQLKGKANLTDAEWTDVAAPSSSYKFYKYTLSL